MKDVKIISGLPPEHQRMPGSVVELPAETCRQLKYLSLLWDEGRDDVIRRCIERVYCLLRFDAALLTNFDKSQ